MHKSREISEGLDAPFRTSLYLILIFYSIVEGVFVSKDLTRNNNHLIQFLNGSFV